MKVFGIPDPGPTGGSALYITWQSNEVVRTSEVEALSALTLAGIVLGLVALLIDVFKDGILLSYRFAVYPKAAGQSGSVPMKPISM